MRVALLSLATWKRLDVGFQELRTSLSRIRPATLDPKLVSALTFTFGETKLPRLPIVFTIATLKTAAIPPRWSVSIVQKIG